MVSEKYRAEHPEPTPPNYPNNSVHRSMLWPKWKLTCKLREKVCVFKERGHLSKNCPKYAHGIYPKNYLYRGGCCKICGSVTHLAKDCPDKWKQVSVVTNESYYRSMGAGVRPSGQVTKFVSGDDIEDDFVTDDINSGDKNKSSKSKDGDVKPKKGRKVVVFN